MNDLTFGKGDPYGVECASADIFSSAPPGFNQLIRTTRFILLGSIFGAGYFLLVEPYPQGYGWILFTISMVLGPFVLWGLKVLWDRPKAEKMVIQRSAQVGASSLRTAESEKQGIGRNHFIDNLSGKLAPVVRAEKDKLEKGRKLFWAAIILLVVIPVVIRFAAWHLEETADFFYRAKRAYILSGIGLVFGLPLLGMLVHGIVKAIPRKKGGFIRPVKEGRGFFYITGKDRTVNAAIPDSFVCGAADSVSERAARGHLLQQRLRNRSRHV